MMNPLKLLKRARANRRAAVVREMAGLPVGAQRRGTVLILVIGALALISVIMLVYATIGQGDRRQQAATKVHTTVETTALAMADYIAQKIADGTTSTYVNMGHQPVVGGPVQAMVVRADADIPATDSYMQSVRAPGATGLLLTRRFEATGSSSDLWTLPVRDP